MVKNKAKNIKSRRIVKVHAVKIPKKASEKKTKSRSYEALDAEKLKEGMIGSNVEHRYDRLFEQKLAEQYREFRHLKEHNMQMKKFFRIMMVIITIILVAVLLLTFT